MDRSAIARRRRIDAAQPTTTRTPIRDKTIRLDKSRHSGKIRTAKDSNEITRVPRTADVGERPTTAEDPSARHFTVGNVGAGGTLYLKPSRMPPAPFTQPPATPPDTSDGDTIGTQWPGVRGSGLSGTWTPQRQVIRGSTYDRRAHLPPPSMANVQSKRRPRSHSFTSVPDHVRSPTINSTDFQLLLNDVDVRPKSSVDLSAGLLDLHIPHYRLGTPTFTDRGTAYLHNSMYTSNSEDMRSSAFSRAEFDKLFPAPPGQSHMPSFASRNSSSFLHPAHAATPRTPSLQPSTTSDVNPTLYNAIGANPDDPSMVRYHPNTRQILAATPGRLVAQITSPMFLDYELLSDFFLTFRNFLTCRDLLEYLLARLKWALGTSDDDGRIIRVRTFVALRHWILNYFNEDFAMDTLFRQRFCNLVNDLARHLRRRHDNGGSDINIIGELKKCWRRTCAMFWPDSQALDGSADAEITPGGDRHPSMSSLSSAPLAIRQQPSKADFRRVSTQLIPIYAEKRAGTGTDPSGAIQAFGPDSEVRTVRSASIPTSPMSEESLQVLSCSIPFLRHLRPTANASGAPRPVVPLRNPPLSGKPSRPMHQHKRSGSFSDALRDGRSPLPSNKVDISEIKMPRAPNFTGGLVRGLLLQPSPAKVELLIPISPGLNVQAPYGNIDANYFDGRIAPNSNQGVKRMMGDVRRALSGRRGPNDSPVRTHRSAGSADSRSSTNLGPGHHEKPNQGSSWQQLRGPPRVDLLGSIIVELYADALFDDVTPGPDHASLVFDQDQEDISPGPEASDYQQQDALQRPPPIARLNSGVTTGTRSIVIVDDTRMPEMPQIPRTLPSISSMSSDMMPKALFRGTQSYRGVDDRPYHARSVSPGQSAPRESDVVRQRYSEAQMHDLLAVPSHRGTGPASPAEGTPHAQARKSSGIHPPDLDATPMRHQLRRRPGGDLKAAGHVHELEPAHRPLTSGSLSTISRSQATSATQSTVLSGTHFQGHNLASWRMPSYHGPENNNKTDSMGLLETHSSQPNLRPSFQAQVSKLAKLPNRSFDGGIEDTLMRLEGKKSGSLDGDNTSLPHHGSKTGHEYDVQASGAGPLRVTNISISTDDTTSREDGQAWSPRTETQGASIYHLSTSDVPSDMNHRQSRSTRRTGSDIPVLQTAWEKSGQSEHPTTKLDNVPTSARSQGSFLLDDNESLSDISTEIADDQDEDDGLGVRSFFFDDTMDDEDPLQPSFEGPPTPPSTVGAPTDQSPERDVRSFERPTPLERPLKGAVSAPKVLYSPREVEPPPVPTVDLRRVKTSSAQSTGSHLPFVLAFESEVIAEQLTIIEKDALDEVDWKDLITLNWHQSPNHIHNWVEYLMQEDDYNGVDIVVARFNLVVKWVISECILTEAPSERAGCVTKYIHIASHCHRFRNYASMYQITLALLSSDLARLHATWALVPPAEKQILERLEKLCHPLRNFSNLRAEMESSSLESGCIPFIGLYTHDLVINAQKPSRVDPTPPSKEPLVNFERYQTAAMVVKSLLRLIEASSKYVFHPHPEVLSRCLWLAALDDGEISARSKRLE